MQLITMEIYVSFKFSLSSNDAKSTEVGHSIFRQICYKIIVFVKIDIISLVLGSTIFLVCFREINLCIFLFCKMYVFAKRSSIKGLITYMCRQKCGLHDRYITLFNFKIIFTQIDEIMNRFQGIPNIIVNTILLIVICSWCLHVSVCLCTGQSVLNRLLVQLVLSQHMALLLQREWFATQVFLFGNQILFVAGNHQSSMLSANDVGCDLLLLECWTNIINIKI